MPYNLVFGAKVMLPLKVQLPSLRVVAQVSDPGENTQLRLAELEALDEHRLLARQWLEIYQPQMAGTFNKLDKFHSLMLIT